MLHIQLLRIELLGAELRQCSSPPARLTLPSSAGSSTLAGLTILVLCLGWNCLPLNLEMCPAVHTDITRISACSYPALPSASPVGSCHSSWAPFPVLTFEMSEMKVLTLCFPEVSNLNCCMLLQPSKVGKVAVSFVRPLAVQPWEGHTRPCPAPSQVQAIPASPAELFQLLSQFLSRPWAQPAHKYAVLWKLNQI